MQKDNKIIITGSAGLVGQNLILLLREKGYTNLVAIDKNQKRLALLKKMNPDVQSICVDLATDHSWDNVMADAECVILLHAHITGIYYEDFVKNNIHATENVIQKIIQYKIPYTVHVSSSVINSIVKDFYTNTKTKQEKLVLTSGINYCILRPTLMFGWFDPKHLGWLSNFIERVPLFPIPGHGKYARQPLYSRDFCEIIIAAMNQRPIDKIFDIVGNETIDYIDMIKAIKSIKRLKTKIVKIPYSLFDFLLKIYALFDKNPPFTSQQLKALTTGDYFSGIDPKIIFGVSMTPFEKALFETLNHPVYSQIKVSSN